MFYSHLYLEKTMPKMIVMDLDGTLLDDNKNISTYTISILEKCKEAGIIIAFTTVRSIKATKRISNLVNPDILILNDGALNGINEIKSIAEHICNSNNNDGVAKWIEENVLTKGFFSLII